MKRLVILSFLLAITCARGPTAVNGRGYIFTAPKRLLAGEAENACFSIHNLEPPVHVFLDLVATSSPTSSSSTTTPEDEVIAGVTHVVTSGTEACVELRIPATCKYSMGKLRLRMKFDKHPDYNVKAEKKVLIEHDSLVTFVETDKPIYKPSQDVNIRILTLKHDFKPWKKPIPKVWIENPSDVRVAQWTYVNTENGLAQLSFPLSPEPSFGTWRIMVEKSRPQLIHVSNFEVKRYVLPRFQVKIRAPSYILADSDNATWRVCVRYSYGQPVKGKLILSLQFQTPIWRRKQTLPEIKHAENFDSASDGCTNYTVTASKLGLPDWKVAPNNIVLLANFTETGTGVVETASSRTAVVHQPLKLEFMPHTPKNFKPGLPYHGKLRVLRPDASSPAPNEKVQLCLKIRGKDEWQHSVVECKNFTSSNDGFLDFIVPPQHKNVVLLSFVATAVDYPTKYYSPDKPWRVFVDQPSSYINVEPWYSPSASYLSVSRGHQPIVCGEKYSFSVMYTAGNPSNAEDKNITFHHSVNSKGHLLIFGHIDYNPQKDITFNYSEFRNLLGAVENNGGNANPIVHRFPLSVTITPSMAPISELLLYYVRSDGEVVTTTHSIEVGNCFENKVKTAWHEETQTPGSKARFYIEASPLSICGISAVDESTRYLPTRSQRTGQVSEPNLVDAQTAFGRLKSFHLAPDSQPIQSVWSHCAKKHGSGSEIEDSVEEIDHLTRPAATAIPQTVARKKRHSVTYNAGVNYVDAIQAFDDFGTIVMSDLILETRPCSPWVSSYGLLGRRSGMFNRDEPDMMLKAVKAMPLAFHRFPAADSTVVEADAIRPAVRFSDSSADPQASVSVRSYFPETWLWELISTGPEGKAMIERTLPHTITDWIGNTICVSAKHGLGIATPTRVTAFQPFFLDYTLPYSVKRGEELRLKVSLFNYMQHSLPVSIKLEDSDGLDLFFNRSAQVSYCVKARDSVIHEYVLIPRKLGDINITVSASIDTEFQLSESCGPDTLVPIRDVIIKPILVKAEGFPVEITKSAFICPKDFSDDSAMVWELDLPKSEELLIEGSVRGHVSLIGDILGPALDNLDKLVRLPTGCGEQNMILFVPNIHAIAYLDAIKGEVGSELRAKAVRNMEKGYQRELNYRHPDGSYSAFGAADGSENGSMWLTAFVVKSFAQARSLIHIDERDLKLSVKWIVKRQLETGCFPVVGQVFHKDMKGGLKEEDGSSTALTAYVLIALLESGVSLNAGLVNNALSCLDQPSSADAAGTNPYIMVLTTYVLTILQHPKVPEGMAKLLNSASRHNDLVWWEDKSKQDSLSLSIEMTAYAILSLVKAGGDANMMTALKAVRWMSKQRNPEGGFVSTQDTVLGLEALTAYAVAMANATKTDLSILVTASEVDRVLKMNDDNRLVQIKIDLPVLPTLVEVFAEGEGCVLVQSSLRYNKAKGLGSEAFDLSATAETVTIADAVSDRCLTQRLNVCARYKLPDEESNMAVLEIGMVSGFVPDKTSLQDLLETSSNGVKRFEEDRDNVAIYFDKLTSKRICISFLAIRKNVVDKAEPANIKLYDYYQQEFTISTNYRFVDSCNNNATGEPVAERRRHPNEPLARISTKEDNRQPALSHGKMTREKKEDPSALFERTPIVKDHNLIKQFEDGSGRIDEDVLEKGFLPAFVNVDHELDTPDGMEGPVPVYVEAPPSFKTTKSFRDGFASSTTRSFDPFVPVPVPDETDAFIPKPEHSTPPRRVNCPRCGDMLPSDIKELFCSSNTVIKLGIRRMRKAKMLLDLRSPVGIKRLRSSLEFLVHPQCYCPPLDKAGSYALLLSSASIPSVINRTTETLDSTAAIFSLPLIGGTPPEILEARDICFSLPHK